jgi:hypothetical protein
MLRVIWKKAIRFGLSKKEAKIWLSKEPNYNNKRKVTDYERKDKTDDNETEPLFSPKRMSSQCTTLLC